MPLIATTRTLLPHHNRAMHVFLRRLENGHFLNRIGVWTESVSQARDFEDSENASEAAKKLGLHGVELVIVRDDGTMISACKLDL